MYAVPFEDAGASDYGTAVISAPQQQQPSDYDLASPYDMASNTTGGEHVQAYSVLAVNGGDGSTNSYDMLVPGRSRVKKASSSNDANANTSEYNHISPSSAASDVASTRATQDYDRLERNTSQGGGGVSIGWRIRGW